MNKARLWLNSCGFNTEKVEVNGKNCKKAKYSSKNVRYCPVCGNILQRGQAITCSAECNGQKDMEYISQLAAEPGVHFRKVQRLVER